MSAKKIAPVVPHAIHLTDEIGMFNLDCIDCQLRLSTICSICGVFVAHGKLGLHRGTHPRRVVS